MNSFEINVARDSSFTKLKKRIASKLHTIRMNYYAFK